jgi:hypothetical protein
MNISFDITQQLTKKFSQNQEDVPEALHGRIGCVQEIWEVACNQFYVKIEICQKLGTQPDNKMTIITKQGIYSYSPAQVCNLATY